MANITRFTPFEDVFGDLMKGFWVKPVTLPGGEEMKMKLDVKEDDKAFTVHAEIPGVKKDDIHVHVDGDVVSIAAEVHRESERKDGEKVLHSERYYGKVYRSFTLGQDVDENGAKARFDNGVLELSLPKKAVSASKRLAIE